MYGGWCHCVFFLKLNVFLHALGITVIYDYSFMIVETLLDALDVIPCIMMTLFVIVCSISVPFFANYETDNWSVKAIRRKTTGTGRMRYLRHVPQRFKSNFREGIFCFSFIVNDL